MYSARTRYSQCGERKLLRGPWTGPTPHKGILVLQREEDVKTD